MSAPLALTRPLTGAGAGKPRAAGRPMTVAAMPLVPALSGAAALRAAAGSHPIVAATTATATAKLVANVVAAPAWLADREVGGPPFFLVTFDARQRGAYQLAMHGTVLDVRHALVVILVEVR